MIERTDHSVATAWCGQMINFVGLLGSAKLNGTKFDVVLFFERVREPRPGGAGVDTSGCSDLRGLTGPVEAEFVALVRSAQSQ